MKILFIHCWQTGNTGDNAIWESMISHLKSAFPDSTLTICSQRIEKWDMDQLSEVTMTKVIPMELVREIDRREFNNLHTNDDIKGYLQSKVGSATKELKEADIVMSQGGGYMNGDWMWAELSYIYIAQHLGKPTFYGSQTFIGGVREQTKRLAKIVFDNADLVVAREKESLKFITEYIGAEGSQIKLLPDGVFTVRAKTYINPIPQNAVKIGIRGYLTTPELLKEIAKFADMAVETLGPVVFIPVSNGERNDAKQAKEIAEMMKHESIVVDNKPDAGELLDILKDGILISDRYHGIVYSASVCTPFVPLTPDIGRKMPGLLKMIDYPFDKILSTKTTNAEEIFEYATAIWKRKEEIRKHLEKTIPEVKRKAELAYKYIIEGIKKYGFS